jgi:lipoprotein signal peptidase
MAADEIKLWFTYGLATVIIIGGGVMLFVSRNEANTDFALLIAGFIGGAVGFIFNRESATQATRAAQSSANQAVAAQAPPA